MHTGLPLFYRVTIEVMGVDLQAVRERHGLSMLFGFKPGSAALAEVFAPTGEIANPAHAPETLLACQSCAISYADQRGLADLIEIAGRK